ncbi:MAG: altronate dehydratase family protein [Synergistaceae bacterium]|jgi:altronate hydrolase|nr:altronate dehydratase family protein [Synergistaceae bacterium]
MNSPEANIQSDIGVILLNDADNIVVLTCQGRRGQTAFIEGQRLTLRQDIPGGHKAARVLIPKGERIVKYGHPIGTATRDIAPGEHVHEHNVGTRLGEGDADLTVWDSRNQPRCGVTRLQVPLIAGTFAGYRRDPGRPGVRNDLWVIPTVGCVNGELRALVQEWSPKKPAWIDDVKVLEHPFGCSQLGGDLTMTADLLAGLARHPNAAGVLLAGLGCENLQIPMLIERVGPEPRLRVIRLQDGEGDFAPLLDELADAAPRYREPFPASELCIGVKCGGSDGYSGLTANPLLGRFAEHLVASGGTVLATEIPEMFGAEDVIAARVVDRTAHDDFIALDRWFREYFIRHGQPVYENPSPGNREGGITTLEEKSLGAVEKSGNAPVTQVLRYGQSALSGGGVQIVFAPGNDIVSCTSLAASGAQMILFTTGRGTPFGTVVPTIKVSTNSELAAKHPNWIDFDAGRLLTGQTWEAATESLTGLILRVAGGERAAHERKGIGEIAIFKDGVTL